MVRKKLYRTRKGKTIDMEAMRAANERTVASGNMGVNAKGDEIKGGKVVKTAKERVAPYYDAKKQVARTSIKPPIKKKDAQINTPVVEEAEEAPTIVSQTDRTRDDGSTYKEIMFSDGSMEVKELKPAPAKKKATKKKAKKKTSKKTTKKDDE